MSSNKLRQFCWKFLLILSNEAYQRRMCDRIGVEWPVGFDETRSIFVHIPKTAGISLGSALYGHPIPHHTWQQWELVNPKKFKAYFKFAVVREPVNRFCSAFDYLKAGGMNPGDKAYAEKMLARFKSASELANAMQDPAFSAKLLDQSHFTKQSAYVTDGAGRSRVDFLVRFEDLAQGFAKIASAINRSNAELPHLNKTPVRKSVEIDSGSRAILETVYKADFDLWNSIERMTQPDEEIPAHSPSSQSTVGNSPAPSGRLTGPSISG